MAAQQGLADTQPARRTKHLPIAGDGKEVTEIVPVHYRFFCIMDSRSHLFIYENVNNRK